MWLGIKSSAIREDKYKWNHRSYLEPCNRPFELEIPIWNHDLFFSKKCIFLALFRLRPWGERSDRGWEGWMASLSEHEFEQTPGDSEEQDSLECCSSWGHKELNVT